jgi:hypothetical protein
MAAEINGRSMLVDYPAHPANAGVAAPDEAGDYRVGR